VLLVSGGALAVVQLARIDALWTTSYGWVFLAKIGAVLVLLGLAAVNRFMLAPPIDAGSTAAARRQLRQSIAVELGIALAILGIAALWRFTPPPRSIIAVETASEFIHFHDGRAMADLTLEPGRVGRSSGEIVIRDGQYQPMMPKGVTLMFFQPATGIEPLRREAVDVGDYTWRVENIVIPTPGRWRLRIEILLNDFEKLTLEDDIQIRP
jgi:copper transport protein